MKFQFQTIKLEVIQNQYPEVLQHLFQAGPSDAFFVVKCWANVSFGISNEQMSLYAVDSFYDSNMDFDISVSTKVCSFGKQVVEKVEVSPFARLINKVYLILHFRFILQFPVKKTAPVGTRLTITSVWRNLRCATIWCDLSLSSRNWTKWRSWIMSWKISLCFR